MPARALLLVVSILVCAVPAVAGNRRARVACKQSCAQSISECAEQTGRLRKCKKQVVRRCVREGIAVCTPQTETQTLCVATTGSDAADCGSPDAPCRSIQFAIDHRVPAGGAGIIKIGAGTFDGMGSCGTSPTSAVVCIVNKQITLLGGFVAPNWDTASGDPAATVIDAQGAGRGVHVVRGGEVGPDTSLVAEGLTIQNGLVEAPATGPLAERSAFGGGLYAQHSAITLRNVVFRDNEARGGVTSEDEGGRGAGGALAAYSGWASVAAPAVLQGVRFESNRARGGVGVQMGGYALGGAMFTHSIGVTGDDVVFAGNTATAGATDGAGTNGAEKADALGGALAVGIHGVVELQGVQATDNVATGGEAPNGEAGGAFGGALYAEAGTLTVVGGRLAGNRAVGGDGSNDTTGGSVAQGGAVQVLQSSLTLDRVEVVANEARSGNGVDNGGIPVGGGVAVILGEFENSARPFTIRNSVLADNALARGTGTLVIGAGGGLFVNGATGLVEHSTIADNHLDVTDDAGGGIAVLPVPGWETNVDVVDSIIANHRDPGVHPLGYSNAGLWVAAGASAAVRRVLYANNLHDSNAGIDDPYNLPPGTFTENEMWTDADAGFAAPGDYHLLSGSPAIDRAVGSTVAVDLDGNARPAGAASDLGAYEFLP